MIVIEIVLSRLQKIEKIISFKIMGTIPIDLMCPINLVLIEYNGKQI